MPRPKDGMYSKFNTGAMDEICALVPDFKDSDQAQGWYVKITNRAWFVRRYEEHHEVDLPSKVYFDAAYKCWQYADGTVHGFIDLRSGRHNPMQLLHILAHILQPSDTDWHKAEFSQMFMDLALLAYKDLPPLTDPTITDAKAFRKKIGEILRAHKIKTRIVSEETREKRRESFNARNVRGATERVKKIEEEVERILAEHLK